MDTMTYDIYIHTSGTNGTRMEGDNIDFYDPLFQQHCSEDLLDQPELKVSAIIQRYIFPILLLIGTIGNLTSIRYLHNLSINVWSTCLYLTVLSLVDLLVLYVDCGNKWFMVITEINLSEKITETSGAICKVYPFIYQFFLHLSPWIIVAASVELTIALRLPHLTYKMCTCERAKAIMLLMTVLLICLNMHYFWTYGLVKYAEPPDFVISVCVYIEEFSEYFRDTIWPFMNLAVGQVIPLVVVAVCFFISILSFFKSDHGKRVNLDKYFMDIKSLKQLKVTFIIICLFYVVVVTMKILLVVVQYLMAQKVITIPCAMESHVLAVMQLLGALWDMLFYMFLSVKFFIYFAVCKRFRQDVCKLFLKLCCCCRRQNHQALKSDKKCVSAKPLVANRKCGKKDNSHSNFGLSQQLAMGKGVSTEV